MKRTSPVTTRELSALTETQRTQALKHFQLIRPFLKAGIPLTTIARKHQLSVRTLRRWAQQYRSQGLALDLGLNDTTMNKNISASQGAFLKTKEYQRFAEFCDACRQHRYIGLCHGSPGVGKTLSSWQYAKWHLIQPYFPERFYVEYRIPYIERVIAETIAANPVSLPPEIGHCQSILYTPTIANTPKGVEQEIRGNCSPPSAGGDKSDVLWTKIVIN